MSESFRFHPSVAWVDWNGPFDESGECVLTIQDHCSNRVMVGDTVLCVDEDMVSWGIVDHLEPSFQGEPDVCVYIRHASRTPNDSGFAYLEEL